MHKVSKLHYITQDVQGVSHTELAELACKGGVDWVQLRLKNKSDVECFEIAKEVQKVCKKYNAKFIINDNVMLAKTINAEGVHLGKTDMPVKAARKILGKNFIIGGTANTPEDVIKLNVEGVDYIGLGPFRFTKTKENLSPVLGLDGIKKASQKSCTPVIAIGGITPEDIYEIIKTGVHGIAVSSAINLAKNREESAKKFIKSINECHAELVSASV